MEIQTLSLKREEAFYQMIREYLPGSDVRQVQEKALQYPEASLLVTEGNQLIGVIYGWPREAALPSLEFCLDGIAIHADYWNKGIGSMLLSTFEKKVLEYGYPKVSVGSAGGHVEKFYLKNGYVPCQYKTFSAQEGKYVIVKEFSSMADYETYVRVQDGFVVMEKILNQ